MKQVVVRAIATGAVLAVVWTAWFWVANRSAIAGPSRHALKEALFWTGALLMVGHSGAVSLGNRAGWIRRTALSAGVSVLVAAGLYSLMCAVLGGPTAVNSYFLADAAGVRTFELVVSAATLITGAVGLSLVVGLAARRASRWLAPGWVSAGRPP